MGILLKPGSFKADLAIQEEIIIWIPSGPSSWNQWLIALGSLEITPVDKKDACKKQVRSS